MTCRPHKIGSAAAPALAALVLETWVPERLFRPIPSFAPTFFQLLLCALMARCKPPGEVLKAQSVVGGVSGGVMGSLAGGEFVPLSSVRSSRSAGSLDEDTERLLASPLRLILRWGRNDGLGDRPDSSLGDGASLDSRVRVRDLPCLDFRSVGLSWAKASLEWAESDSKKGTRTESLINSYTILTASSNSAGSGGEGPQGSANR